jgi:hypothetical protein
VVCFPEGKALTDEVLGDVGGQHLRYEDLTQPSFYWSHGAYNAYMEEEEEEEEEEDEDEEKEKEEEEEEEKELVEYA